MDNKIIIALEGIDGAGKSTLLENISILLGDKNIYIYKRTQMPLFIKRILNKISFLKYKMLGIILYALIANLNYFKNRSKIMSSDIIIMDRCFISNLCYFSRKSLVSKALFKTILSIEPKIFPQNIFILEVDISVAFNRDPFKKSMTWLNWTYENYVNLKNSFINDLYNIHYIPKEYNIDKKIEIILNTISIEPNTPIKRTPFFSAVLF